MERLERHYSALGIELLFKHHPGLEEYLKAEYDDDFVSEVHSSSCSVASLASSR